MQRQTLPALLMLATIFFACFAPAAGTGTPTPGSFPGTATGTFPGAPREFNSKWKLKVWTINEDGIEEPLGETPATQPLLIPAGVDWGVTPIGAINAQLFEDIRQQHVPGFALPWNASEDWFEHVKNLKELRTLNLWQTQVTDAGLVHLKDLKELRALSLRQTKVTDAGLAHLKDLKELRELDLSDTHVTDAGLDDLRQALPKCYMSK